VENLRPPPAAATPVLPHYPGRAVQVQPMKPVLKAPGSMLLKLRYDGPLSKFAFRFNLRHYTPATRAPATFPTLAWISSPHSSTPGRQPRLPPPAAAGLALPRHTSFDPPLLGFMSACCHGIYLI